MMLRRGGNVLTLAGGLRVKARVQHQPDGTVKTLRKYKDAGPSKGENGITKKQAEIERDKFLARLNAGTLEVAVEQVSATGVAFFGEVAKMYEDGYLGREHQIAKPTRVKKSFYLSGYIVPKGEQFHPDDTN